MLVDVRKADLLDKFCGSLFAAVFLKLQQILVSKFGITPVYLTVPDGSTDRLQTCRFFAVVFLYYPALWPASPGLGPAKGLFRCGVIRRLPPVRLCHSALVSFGAFITVHTAACFLSEGIVDISRA